MCFVSLQVAGNDSALVLGSPIVPVAPVRHRPLIQMHITHVSTCFMHPDTYVFLDLQQGKAFTSAGHVTVQFIFASESWLVIASVKRKTMLLFVDRFGKWGQQAIHIVFSLGIILSFNLF